MSAKRAEQEPHPSGFDRFAAVVADFTGHPLIFASAMALVLVWAAAGPIFGFSETWQLVINTGTTIITFLMVFLIQATQNRDGRAVQLKLDELIRVTRDAHADLIDLEEQPAEVIEAKLEEMRAARNGSDSDSDR